LKMATKVHL